MRSVPFDWRVLGEEHCSGIRIFDTTSTKLDQCLLPRRIMEPWVTGDKHVPARINMAPDRLYVTFGITPCVVASIPNRRDDVWDVPSSAEISVIKLDIGEQDLMYVHL